MCKNLTLRLIAYINIRAAEKCQGEQLDVLAHIIKKGATGFYLKLRLSNCNEKNRRNHYHYFLNLILFYLI